MKRAHLHISGIVQGVGMRPYVYRMATAAGIGGWVLNAGDGVHVEAHAPDEASLESFIRSLRANAPAASRIDRIEVEPLENGPHAASGEDGGFRIAASDSSTDRSTLVSPDIATCPECLAELFDPNDRRYHYPFINCTNCGPRFTIIRSLPYDRSGTSMDAFPMCPRCEGEYSDPADRRFHAQPDACFECGPHITWREAGSTDRLSIGSTLERSDGIISRAADVLASGGIVAVKGLGGFHLACDAADEGAVRRLRERKRRPRKPLAVMAPDIASARRIIDVEGAEDALTGPVRPIVLARRIPRAGGIAPSVAFELPELGVVLPYTPLQHLLMAACRDRGVDYIVMTSGNVSGMPIETDDKRAWEHLVEGGIADALLGNDRPILARYDDSVVRPLLGRVFPVRRARGYAPRPIALPPSSSSEAPRRVILACGAEQKATLAVVRPGDPAQCIMSQHIGDLGGSETFGAWDEARLKLEDLFGLSPDVIACDLHEGYLSSRWARAEAERRSLPLMRIQHHHAHIASVIAEAAGLGEIDRSAEVVGIALDGTGAGDDGTIWGCEIMATTLSGFSRMATLRPWRLPGGAAAVRDARRCALGLLIELGLEDHPGAAGLRSSLTSATCSVLETMVARSLNSPLTSSGGRLFDAVAAILGIAGRASYEGEPAIELEASAWRWLDSHPSHGPRPFARAPEVIAPFASARHPSGCTRGRGTADHGEAGGALLQIDSAPVIESLLDSAAAGIDVGLLSLEFHRSFVQAVCRAAEDACRLRGVDTVALSGGVFMNRLVLSGVYGTLSARGLRVLVARNVPVNDGCISLGQAAIARALLDGTARNRGNAA